MKRYFIGNVDISSSVSAATSPFWLFKTRFIFFCLIFLYFSFFLLGLGFRGNVDVVAYCAVGMRASRMAQRINDELERTKEVEGHKIRVPMKVYNLEGSMFKWTNEGKPLVDYQGHETQYCHPVSYFRGLLIPENKRKY